MENDCASPCLLMHDHYNRLSEVVRDGNRPRRTALGIRQNDVTILEIAETNSANPSNNKAALSRAATLAKGRWRHD
jgi:hypothetical protein